VTLNDAARAAGPGAAPPDGRPAPDARLRPTAACSAPVVERATCGPGAGQPLKCAETPIGSGHSPAHSSRSQSYSRSPRCSFVRGKAAARKNRVEARIAAVLIPFRVHRQEYEMHVPHGNRLVEPLEDTVAIPESGMYQGERRGRYVAGPRVPLTYSGRAVKIHIGSHR
jgi:hypothetical protein